MIRHMAHVLPAINVVDFRLASDQRQRKGMARDRRATSFFSPKRENASGGYAVVGFSVVFHSSDSLMTLATFLNERE